MAQSLESSSEPSYLLADFPSPHTLEGDFGASNKDPNVSMSEPSSKDADSPRPIHALVPKGHAFRRGLKPGRVLADCTSTILPLVLLGFAIVVSLLDGKAAQREVHQRWENAVTIVCSPPYAPCFLHNASPSSLCLILTDGSWKTASVFPILFASIVGRMVYEAARWKLEKGATLGLLEQLIGSRTVGSTFLTQIYLRKFNLLSLILLLIWAFSPLGSQSVLRMLRTRFEPVNESSQVLYYPTDARSLFSSVVVNDPVSSASWASISVYIQGVYTALFLSSLSAKTNAMDLWGNVKIPRLEIDSRNMASGDNWHSISSITEPDFYSALVGLPVTNVTKGNATFFLESSYVDLQCSELIRNDSFYAIQSSFNWSDPDLWNAEPKPNGTWYGANYTTLRTPWTMALDRFVGDYWVGWGNVSHRSSFNTNMMNNPILFENETDLDAAPSKLLFQAGFQYQQRGSDMGIKTECEVVQRYVESRVACSRVHLSAPHNCSVTAQRFSRKKHAPEAITLLSFERVWGYVTRTPEIMGSGLDYPDTVLRYLDDPRLNNLTQRTREEDKDLLSKVSPQQFGRRLSQVLNTYLLLSQLYQYASQGNLDWKAKFEPNVTMPVEVSNLVEVYTVNWSWITLFFVSCAVLFASGIVSTVFAHLAVGPEILGYASSVVRDSKYIDLAPEIGGQEAIAITRMMSQQRIKFGFVNSAAEHGQPLLGVGLEDHSQSIRGESTIRTRPVTSSTDFDM
ncbi:hypothetical protein NM208_g4577 [Fusarium decemcellulare]|uniref:Uncharacterized protein n=1 Tax=Fusarium decemcellulare TaxID=57161 RepID=A0ACC1SK33_9HYPO|nr:hypothetical protein NM208_g4577 [Fusarium decemcellulare]